MAKKANQKETVDLAKSLQAVLTNVDSLLSHMDSVFNSFSDKIKKTNTDTKGWKDTLEGIRKLNKSYAESLEDSLKSQKAKTLAAKSGLNVDVAALVIAKHQAKAAAMKEGASLKELHTLKQQFDEAIKITKEQVKQKEESKKAEELAEKIKKYDHERKEILEKITEKQKLIKSIITDQRLASAVFTAQMIKGAESVAHAFEHIREEGFTMTQALTKTGKAAQIAFNPFNPISMKEALGAMKGLTEELGSMENVTKDTIKQSAMLAKTFGISEEMGGKLTGQVMQLPGATLETAKNTLEYAGGLAKAAHVAPGRVMAEIANNSEAFALYAKDGGKNVATAAVAAAKLGMEFGSLTKMADQLLDFESSINKQMEASVLLGKQINLDKAREAALNGDLVGMTQEVLKNVGGEAEFNKMNQIQRKALADSLGVSVQDLSKMVKNQDKLNDLTQEQREALADGSLTMDQIAASAGGIYGKIKETGLTIVSAVGSIGQFAGGIKAANQMAMALKNTKLATYIAERAQGAWKLMFGAKEIAQQSTITAIEQKRAAGNLTKSGGASKMGDGMGKMNVGKIAQGAAAMVLMAAAVFVFAKALQELDKVEDMEKSAQGVALFAGMLLASALILKVAGSALADPMIMLGVAVLSVAFLSLGYSLKMAAPAIKAFGEIVIGVLDAVPAIITAIADGFVKMFTTISENIGALLALGPALMMIGAGLGMISFAGIGALPILGALTALAVTAPALAGLGTAIGGMFGGGEEEDKMDTLIGKIDQLITIASQGGIVNMDGKKVGEVVRLGLNSAGLR